MMHTVLQSGVSTKITRCSVSPRHPNRPISIFQTQPYLFQATKLLYVQDSPVRSCTYSRLNSSWASSSLQLSAALLLYLTGTGKTLNIQKKLLSGMSDKFVPVFVNFSAQTSRCRCASSSLVPLCTWHAHACAHVQQGMQGEGCEAAWLSVPRCTIIDSPSDPAKIQSQNRTDCQSHVSRSHRVVQQTVTVVRSIQQRPKTNGVPEDPMAKSCGGGGVEVRNLLEFSAISSVVGFLTRHCATVLRTRRWELLCILLACDLCGRTLFCCFFALPKCHQLLRTLILEWARQP